MAKAPIRADLHQAIHVQADLAAQVALDLVLSIDDLAAEVAMRLTVESELSPEVVRGLADAVADHVATMLAPGFYRLADRSRLV